MTTADVWRTKKSNSLQRLFQVKLGGVEPYFLEVD